MIKRIFKYQAKIVERKSWLYSFISVLNVVCGIAVTAVIWFRYSAGRESDILLLATSSISILAQLSLVGVEQVLYFYAHAKQQGFTSENRFFKISFTWSLLSGLIFTLFVIAIVNVFLNLIAPGLPPDSLHEASFLLICLSPQLILSPMLHVFRAKWSLEEKFGRAYLLSSVSSFILLLCLIIFLISPSGDLRSFGKLAALVYTLFLFSFLFFNRKLITIFSYRDWKRVKLLVVQSSRIKGANAIHNFLVQALISGILSLMPTGSISIFQYAKKMADGVFAITAGPQVMIYHARCAVSVSNWNMSDMLKNARNFLKTFLPLFLAMAMVVYLMAPIALSIIGKTFSMEAINEIRSVYVGVVIWYLIIGIETISVGVLLATHNSWLLFLINLIFIVLFFGWSHLHHIDTSLELIYTTGFFQMSSFVLFNLAAIMIVNRGMPRAG